MRYRVTAPAQPFTLRPTITEEGKTKLSVTLTVSNINLFWHIQQREEQILTTVSNFLSLNMLRRSPRIFLMTRGRRMLLLKFLCRPPLPQQSAKLQREEHGMSPVRGL